MLFKNLGRFYFFCIFNMEILVLNCMIIYFYLFVRICNWGFRFIIYVLGKGFRLVYIILNLFMSIFGYFYIDGILLMLIF